MSGSSTIIRSSNDGFLEIVECDSQFKLYHTYNFLENEEYIPRSSSQNM